MLLKEVEDALDLDVNVITRKVEKNELCRLHYNLILSSLGIGSYKGLVETKKGEIEVDYHYLFTKSGVYFGEDNYTTTYSIKLYNPSSSIPKKDRVITINNDKLYVECGGKEIPIGYININNYLHLPDYIMVQVLRGGGKVSAVRSGQIIEFENGNAILYKHSVSIPSPYYLFENKFTYYENADILAEIIGAFDVYKRGLIKNGAFIDEDKALKYFLYPYVSMVLYKQTHTTLYPSLIDPIVGTVMDRVKESVLKKLDRYLSNPLNEIEERIKVFNSTEQPILKVFKE
jgi:hypothetical protein